MSKNKKKNSVAAGKNQSFVGRLTDRALRWWRYVSVDVWSDTRDTPLINLTKTLNLSVRSFFNVDLQSQAAAMTFRTLLAIVPALALIFAVGRGLGFQNIIESELFNFFPAQREVLDKAMQFVDSYLSQASQGVFVGVGVVFLLWTLISLLSNIEQSFNKIWGVQNGRSMGRKIFDYTAIILILPIIMICSGGISIFMSSTLQNIINFEFFSKGIEILMTALPYLLTWLFFTAMFMLIPNTKVKFKNAIISGFISAVAFNIIQWLFVTGQVYVTKYNAIYGSFAFLPLLLLWLQLVWLIILAGCVICYSSQNIFQFNFTNDISEISSNYRRKVATVMMSIIARRFADRKPAITVYDFVVEYGMPSRLVSDLIEDLSKAHLVVSVVSDKHEPAFQPAMDVSRLTVGELNQMLNNEGTSDFIKSLVPFIHQLDRSEADATLLQLASKLEHKAKR